MRKTILTATLVGALAAGVAGVTGLSAGFALGHDQAQGRGRCPAEDSCTPDYVGDPNGNGHWVINTIPGDDANGCHWEWQSDGSGEQFCNGELTATRPAGARGGDR